MLPSSWWRSAGVTCLPVHPLLWIRLLLTYPCSLLLGDPTPAATRPSTAYTVEHPC
jgi:hypothetical protein